MSDYYELDQEEESILKDYETGDLKTSPDAAVQKELLEQYAKNTLNKTKNINIRLSERDLYRLRAKAIEEGIPYQTLASSILHKATK
jgi:predicted DNA binding CopG/RHH family protein